MKQKKSKKTTDDGKETVNVVELKRDSISTHAKISQEELPEIQKTISKLELNEDDYVFNLLTAQLKAYFYIVSEEERTICHNFGKPTFFDWILRREKKVEIKIKAKDLFCEPRASSFKTARVYIIDEGNND